MTVFSENLRRIRKQSGISSKDMAASLGVAYSTYATYENGRREPDVLKIRKMAELLHTTGDVLIGIPAKNRKENLYRKLEQLDSEDLQEVEAIVDMKLAKEKYKKSEAI